MATPALNALRVGLPDAKIIGISRPGPAGLLEGTNSIDELLIYRPRGSCKELNRFSLVRKIRDRELDAILLLTNSLSSAAIAWLSKTPRRIGYTGDMRAWLLTDRVLAPEKSSGKLSQIERYLNLVRILGCDASDKRMALPILRRDEKIVSQQLSTIEFSDLRPTVVINNGAASAKARIWPQQYTVHLCRQLAIGLNCQVLLHCGPSDRDETNKIAEMVAHPLVKSMGVWQDISLGVSKAMLARASVVVSSDSGPRHIAAAFDRPVIGLYGPTDPLANRTFNRTETVLESFLECRPCNKEECPLKHHRCMRNIEVDTVRQAIEASLAEQARSRFCA